MTSVGLDDAFQANDGRLQYLLSSFHTGFVLLQVDGDFVHEGRHLDPACRDIEALFDSAQQRVSGTVQVRLQPGSVFIEGLDSPYSLLAATRGVYGEAAGEWTPADARGYARVLSLPGILQQRAGKSGAAS